MQMNSSDSQTLDDFQNQVLQMKLHGSSVLGSALKKPLLVLLLVSRIENSRSEENRFHFGEIRNELETLLRAHGGRPTKSGFKTEQPFSHLRSSPFWQLSTARKYEAGKTALVSDLMQPESFGAFSPVVYSVLRRYPEAAGWHWEA